MDVLIPLAATSNNDFLELKIALRSLAQCSDVGTIYVITKADIQWIQNVKIVPIDDPYTNNKDKNLIRKIHLTLQMFPEITDFVIWMDDFVVTKPIALNEIPDIYNNRGLGSFTKVGLTKWQARLKNTLEIFKLFNKDVSCNWDAHVPIKLNSEKILQGLNNISYLAPGCNFTLCTLLANICDKTKDKAIDQDSVKCTCESAKYVLDTSKLFIGYNDVAFNNGLKDKLLVLFHDKSRYEKTTISTNNCINIFVSNVSNKDKLVNLINAYDKPVMLFSWDDETDKTIAGMNVPIAFNADLAVNSKFLLASMTSTYTILYDGSKDYDINYINSCFDTDITNAALLYDVNNHKGIVNNTILGNQYEQCCTTKDLFSLIDTLVEEVKPIILVRENGPKEL